ncbi:MAG: transposase [Thainema sp.]
MKYNPDKHHRRSIRLNGYDYSSPGAYFITICTHQRECLFGDIVDGKMQLDSLGQIVAEEWLRSQNIRQEINLDAWVIMPNHIHGIVFIQDKTSQQVSDNSSQVSNQPQNPVGANGHSPLQNGHSPIQHVTPFMRPRSLSSFITGFKSTATKRINLLRNTPRTPVWQRNYYEHIIRNKESLEQIRYYIQTNPANWQTDQLHPNNPASG